jgi:hypothetical protein
MQSKLPAQELEEVRGEGIVATIVRELCGNHSQSSPINPISEIEKPLIFANLFGYRWAW